MVLAAISPKRGQRELYALAEPTLSPFLESPWKSC